MSGIQRTLLLVAMALIASGCASWSPPAVSTVRERVQERAEFELDCKQANVELLYQGDFASASIWYLGVVGCGQRAMYSTECSGEFCITRRMVRTPLIATEPAPAPAPGASSANPAN